MRGFPNKWTRKSRKKNLSFLNSCFCVVHFYLTLSRHDELTISSKPDETMCFLRRKTALQNWTDYVLPLKITKIYDAILNITFTDCYTIKKIASTVHNPINAVFHIRYLLNLFWFRRSSRIVAYGFRFVHFLEVHKIKQY